MRRAALILALLPSLSWAAGPRFHHKDTLIDQEFRNVYHDILKSSRTTIGGGGGDITAVNAGSGLSGGALSGDATLSINSPPCNATTEKNIWNGTAWVCGTDQTGVADLSAYAIRAEVAASTAAIITSTGAIDADLQSYKTTVADTYLTQSSATLTYCQSDGANCPAAGGGVSVYPATATASFPFGASFSTMTFGVPMNTYPWTPQIKFIGANYVNGDGDIEYWATPTSPWLKMVMTNADSGSPPFTYSGFNFLDASNNVLASIVTNQTIDGFSGAGVVAPVVWGSSAAFSNGIKAKSLALSGLPSKDCIGTNSDGLFQAGTCGGESGGGYAVEPATVTYNLAKGFTASTGTFSPASGDTAVVITATGTSQGIQMTCHGMAGDAIGWHEDGCQNIRLTAIGDGIVIVASDVVNAQEGARLFSILAGRYWNDPLMILEKLGVDSNPNLQLRAAGQPGIEFINTTEWQDNNSGAGQYKLSEADDIFKIAGRDNADTTFKEVLDVIREGSSAGWTGPDANVVLASSAALCFANYSGDHAACFRPNDNMTGTPVWSWPAGDSEGYWKSDGDGNLSIGAGPTPEPKCVNISSPTATDDVLMWKTDRALTVGGIDCMVVGGTSAQVTVNECDGSGANCSAIEATMTCGTSNTSEDGGIDNASIDAGDWIRVDVGTVTGDVGQVAVCVHF